MELTVFYDVWQMECCGHLIAPGNRVRWIVEQRQARVVPDALWPIDYHYEAHCGEWERLFVLEGTVVSVQLLYKSPLFINQKLNTEKNWKLVPTPYAAGYEPPMYGMECMAYIATMKDCTVRPAREEDLFRDDGEDISWEDEEVDLSKAQTWDPNAPITVPMDDDPA